MMKRAFLLSVVLASVSPALAAAQAMGLGLGGRVGTLGLGGEAAIGLTERLVLRGGIGFVPYEPSLTFGDVEVQLKLPTVYNVGLDLYLNGAARIGGGLLFRASDPEVSAEFSQPQDLGGSTFTPDQIGRLTGVFDAADRAPYVLIGFGRHTAAGSGLFIDLGLVFVGEPTVTLDASGGTLDPDTDSAFRSALDLEAAEFEEDMRGYLKIYPIFSLGFRLGAG